MSTRASVILAMLATAAAGTATLAGSPVPQSDLEQFMDVCWPGATRTGSASSSTSSTSAGSSSFAAP